MERGFEVAVVDFFRRDAVFQNAVHINTVHAPLVISRNRLPFRACIIWARSLPVVLMSITASPLPLKLWKPNRSCNKRLNLYAFCVLLKVVGSRLGRRNTQASLGFAAIKPGFETVQGDMFFIGGE